MSLVCSVNRMLPSGTHFRFSELIRRCRVWLELRVRALNETEPKLLSPSSSFVVSVAFLSPNCTRQSLCHAASMAALKSKKRQNQRRAEEMITDTNVDPLEMNFPLSDKFLVQLTPYADVLKYSRLHTTYVTFRKKNLHTSCSFFLTVSVHIN